MHHTNFDDGTHHERNYNPVWTEQVGKIGKHYIYHSCAACHVRNGLGLVEDVGQPLDKWVFKIADALGQPDPNRHRILQPKKEGAGEPEDTVSLGSWTELANGLRQPNYVFNQGQPALFSGRVAPQLVGMGSLDAIDDSTILQCKDEFDRDSNGISGKASLDNDVSSDVVRLGRFGYKVATYSVEHQVASTLNTDMGPGLADDLGQGSATGAEWRTAPLWGLGHTVSVMVGDDRANDEISLSPSNDDIDRIGYLHDRRARTVEEAILWHGVEAQPAKEAYEGLTSQQKAQLLEFLQNLYNLIHKPCKGKKPAILAGFFVPCI